MIVISELADTKKCETDFSLQILQCTSCECIPNAVSKKTVPQTHDHAFAV